MADDGISMRRRTLAFLIVGAIIIVFLLLIPSNTVSYNKADYELEEQENITTTSVLVYFDVQEISSTTEEIEPIEPEPLVDEPVIPIYDPETERILHAIALCESTDRHFDENGDVLMNAHGSSATGRYQLMASIWRPIGASMGIDINTEIGNKEMAYYILKEAQGISAWEASATCLAKHDVFIN